jgi:hypothetical protein
VGIGEGVTVGVCGNTVVTVEEVLSLEGRRIIIAKRIDKKIEKIADRKKDFFT